jgi:hypothetical protein
MGIVIFTKKEAAVKALLKKSPAPMEFFKVPLLSKYKPREGDMTYLDVTGLAAADGKKTFTQLKKRCQDKPWGIIDPKGSKDPAAWFFEGASDYAGPDVLKSGLDAKRLKTAALWRSSLRGTGTVKGKNGGKEPESPAAGLPKTGIKLPAAKFSGWKALPPGKIMPFYLLYCSLQGKTNLSTRLGETAYTQLHKRFLTHLYQNLQEADGLIWMDSGKDGLFLIPPRLQNAETAVTVCMRFLLSIPLITLETLGLSIPVNVVFALHYGQAAYKPPGKTGTVVSDAVNFIFHLGAKKAEPGRLTISGEIPDGTIPKTLEDTFVSVGEYEGRKIWHTKKISYSQPWI